MDVSLTPGNGPSTSPNDWEVVTPATVTLSVELVPVAVPTTVTNVAVSAGVVPFAPWETNEDDLDDWKDAPVRSHRSLTPVLTMTATFCGGVLSACQLACTGHL